MFWVHINTKREIQISQRKFKDLDPEDTLSYSITVENNPQGLAWITYEQSSGMISFAPKGEDLKVCIGGTLSESTSTVNDQYGNAVQVPRVACAYNIIVNATDGYNYALLELAMEIYNNLPYKHQHIYSKDGATAADLEVHVDQMLYHMIKQRTFIDLDAEDTLSISAQMSNGDSLPDWLVYNAQSKIFFGYPSKYDLLMSCAQPDYLLEYQTVTNSLGSSQKVNQQRCTLAVDVIVDDGYDSTAHPFTILITNNQPYINKYLYADPVTKAAMHYLLRLEQQLYYIFDADVFKDLDQSDGFSYKATSLDSEGKQVELPNWLYFQQQTRLFSGTPMIKDLLNCPDMRMNETEVMNKYNEPV